MGLIEIIMTCYGRKSKFADEDMLDDTSYVDPNEELVSELEDGSDGDLDDSEDGDYKGCDSRTKSRCGNGRFLRQIARSISAKRGGKSNQTNQTKFGCGGSKTRRAPAVKCKVASGKNQLPI